LVQAFLKKWWVESDLKAANLSLSLRLKGSGFQTMDFHIVKMYKDKEVSKNIKNIAYQCGT
jgi:hypothetical protein